MAKNKNVGWKKWLIPILLVVVIGVFVGWRRQAGSVVAAFQVERHNIVETVVGIGRVIPPSTIEIGSMRLGPVTRVLVEEGAQVKAGDLMIHLDDKEPLAAVARMTAMVRQERIKLQNPLSLPSSGAGKAAEVNRKLAQSTAKSTFCSWNTRCVTGNSRSRVCGPGTGE